MINDKQKNNKRNGFTLMELLVVIAIISILTAIVFPNLNKSRIKARDARRISDIKSIQLALAVYYDNNRSSGYPADIYAADKLAPTYMPKVPTDPLGYNYAYAAIDLNGSICSSYHLGATLEGDVAPTDDVDDTSPGTECTGSSPNFSGSDSAKCSSSHTSGSKCYDVKP